MQNYFMLIRVNTNLQSNAVICDISGIVSQSCE